MDGPIEGPSRSGSDQSRCNRLAVKYCWLFYTILVYYDPYPVDQKAHGGWGTRCRQLLAVCERGYAWRIALKEGRIKPRLSSFQKNILYYVYKFRRTYMYTCCQASFKMSAQTGTTSAHELGWGWFKRLDSSPIFLQLPGPMAELWQFF